MSPTVATADHAADAMGSLVDQWPFAGALIFIVVAFLLFLLKWSKSNRETQMQLTATFERTMSMMVQSQENSHAMLGREISEMGKEVRRSREATVELVTLFKSRDTGSV